MRLNKFDYLIIRYIRIHWTVFFSHLPVERGHWLQLVALQKSFFHPTLEALPIPPPLLFWMLQEDLVLKLFYSFMIWTEPTLRATSTWLIPHEHVDVIVLNVQHEFMIHTQPMGKQPKSLYFPLTNDYHLRMASCRASRSTPSNLDLGTATARTAASSGSVISITRRVTRDDI